MSFKNKMLVAKPFLKDPVFGGKVILIAKHEEGGGVEGFILNGPVCGKVGFGEVTGPEPQNPTDDDIRKIIEDGSIQSAPLYFGGPCVSPGLFMIHGHEQLAEFGEEKKDDDFEIGGTLADLTAPENEIIQGVYFGNPAIMAKIVMDGLVEQNKFRFFNGVAGWSPGQLEREIEAGAWDVIDATADVVFDIDAANKLAQGEDDEPTGGETFKLPPTPFWN